MNHIRGRILLAAAVVLSLALGGAAVAQGDANRIVYAHSVPVTTLDPAHGAFQAYPAGYEVSYLIYDRLVTFG
ncbi:MAG: hypothetical protein R6X23_08950, partial [Acidimicrobiia bacterium]